MPDLRRPCDVGDAFSRRYCVRNAVATHAVGRVRKASSRKSLVTSGSMIVLMRRRIRHRANFYTREQG